LNKNSRILDVGSGAGDVVYSLKEIGFNHVLGIDAFLVKDFKLENGVSIQKKDIFQIKSEWDLIMFHHSFEHLENPVETIFHVKKILAPGGTCLIRTPVVPSYAWQKYGTNWVQLDAPRHLHIFSVTAMGQLAKSARLEMAAIKYDSTILQFWGSEQYAQSVPLVSDESYFKNPKTPLFSPEQIKKFQVKTDDLNRAGSGDQVVFYLKNTEI
jgi:SAM-dependent methyltransferase